MGLTEEQKRVLAEKQHALNQSQPVAIHVNNFVSAIEYGQFETSEKGKFKKEATVLITGFLGKKPVTTLAMSVSRAIALKKLLELNINQIKTELESDKPFKTKKIEQKEDTESRGVR